MAYFILLNGSLILIKIINPTTASNSVAAVAISADGSEKTSPHITSAPTTKTSVSPAGSAFNKTFLINFPLIRSLFGSNASKNPGIPIVNILINEMCAGSRGYVIINTAENTDISREKMFFTKNRLAERSTLLTTRLPSQTTEGICAKSESSRTTCAACEAASLPDAIATLQSASFMARISLTPSPVIATVCLSFWSACTNCCFCFGVTLPKTVYSLTASSILNCESNRVASI